MRFCTSSSHIQYLDLAHNFFREGSIYLENCTSLQYVFLNGNGLSGTFAENLFELQHFRVLHLQQNQFSGPLSYGIGNLSNLVELDISLNDFSGSLPDIFGRLRKLESFSTSSNRLTGFLPASLVNSPSLLRIDLHNNSLDGPFRINYSAMAQSLRALDLARNKLSGVVPFEFRNLHALESLSLANTSINNISTAFEILQHSYNDVWSFPPTIDLSRNMFSGPIWPSFGNLKNLHDLSLEENNLSGSIPDSISGMTSLEVLDLSRNNLSGEIPHSLARLSFLSVFNVSYNRLYGDTPSGGQFMTFSESSFDGNQALYPRPLAPCQRKQIPPLVSPGKKIKIVDWNFGIGAVTGFLLTVFFCFKSGWSSSHCCSFSGITCDNSSVIYGRVVGLELGNKRLTGTICESLVGLEQLRILNLSLNSLHGKIPANLFHFRNLEVLDLSNNYLVGPLPSAIHLPSIKYLDLSKNYFSSFIGMQFCTTLEILQHCKNLTILDLGLNFYQEEMPSNVNLQFTSLKALIIPFCHLRGSTPIWLSSSIMLQLLDLSWNSLEGSIPSWISKFEYLFYLDLSNNSISREIPESLTGLENLVHKTALLKESSEHFSLVKSKEQGRPRLAYNDLWSFPLTIDLSHNKFTGPIWPSFGNLKNLHVLNLEENNLSGSIPDSISGMTSLEVLDLSYLSWNSLKGSIPSWMGKFEYLFYLDLSNNSFFGEILKCISLVKSKEQGKPRLAYNDVWSFPPTIGLSDNKFTRPIWPSFGKLKNLHVLNLEENNLSRSIPDSISGMTSLEVLDLSPNNISGDIPHSLSQIRLYGETPSEGQFMTFPEASFEGKEALCPRLLAPC
ncbi:hypothetical protein J1N35_015726 [Gossypium stocksii]|uniref:Leucine-rich repeat-containing N-terminal plant-type domain-containing protein n=1 Tax=Gossypium stocksii TaxID=47602 RepID=A0A9D3VXJ0_9ROSI|nr:hypothetical protein J1N35_015726 [Gossypium stocksii]